MNSLTVASASGSAEEALGAWTTSVSDMAELAAKLVMTGDDLSRGMRSSKFSWCWYTVGGGGGFASLQRASG
jgi:hypothetical protein